jgi:hypothetical protein
MAMRRIDIRIDRLVVSGVGAGAGRAVERELTRQLGSGEVTAVARDERHVDAGATAVSAAAGPQAFGQAIAGPVAGHLRGREQ